MRSSLRRTSVKMKMKKRMRLRWIVMNRGRLRGSIERYGAQRRMSSCSRSIETTAGHLQGLQRGSDSSRCLQVQV